MVVLGARLDSLQNQPSYLQLLRLTIHYGVKCRFCSEDKHMPSMAFMFFSEVAVADTTSSETTTNLTRHLSTVVCFLQVACG